VDQGRGLSVFFDKLSFAESKESWSSPERQSLVDKGSGAAKCSRWSISFGQRLLAKEIAPLEDRQKKRGCWGMEWGGRATDEMSSWYFKKNFGYSRRAKHQKQNSSGLSIREAKPWVGGRGLWGEKPLQSHLFEPQ